MKRIIVAGIILISIAVSGFAQNLNNAQILQRFDLTNSEIEQVLELQSKMDRKVREAHIELNILKAQLEKLLFPVDVDMQRVKAVLEQTLEWTLKAELAKIEARVESRKIFGEERWERFLRALKTYREQQAQQNPRDNDPPKPEGQPVPQGR